MRARSDTNSAQIPSSPTALRDGGRGILAHPELHKALDDWRKGDDRVLRSQCLSMLHDIWQRHSDAELEVREEDYVRLVEEAKRFADEPVCQAAMRLFPVLREPLDVIRVGAKWDWPEVTPVELVHPELARWHQAAQEPTKAARQQNA